MSNQMLGINPQNDLLNSVRQLYSGANIDEVLAGIWKSSPSVIDKYDMEDVVRYVADRTLRCKSRPNPRSDEWPHLLTNLQSLTINLEDHFKKELTSDLQVDIQELRQIIKAYRANDFSPSLTSIIFLILRNWNLLKKNASTYSVLMDMALIQKSWRNSTKDRLELLNLIKKLPAAK